MANNYYQATGVLHLRAVTPVITALFESYNLDACDPCDGRAYIATDGEDGAGFCEDITQAVSELCESLGLNVESENEGDADLSAYLFALGDHYKCADPDALAHVIDSLDVDESVSVDQLVQIAKAINDGHDLTAMSWEASWSCSKLRAGEFGGSGTYTGEHFSASGSSSVVIGDAEAFDGYLRNGIHDEASHLLNQMVGQIIAGIHHKGARDTLRAQLVRHLAKAA